MSRYLFGLCLIICGSIGFVSASASRFELEVRPNPLAVNQAVDLIAKVIDQNGNIVKDYDKDVFIEADKLSDSEAELPGGGIYQFQPTDQGNKIFSKGLIIKKEGTFKIMMSDILDDKIKGEVTIVVTKDGSTKGSGYITVISPSPDSIESEPAIHIYGRSELQNSPLEIYLDGNKTKETKTSNNGDFSVYLNDVASGVHLLQLKIKDLSNTLIGSSDEIRFTSLNQNAGLFKSLEILPSMVVKIGTKVTLLVKTSETVSTTEIIFPDAKKIILDRVGPGEFKKELIVDTPGSYPLAVKLTTDTEKKQFDKVKTLTVLSAVTLGPIKALRVQSDPTQIDLNRSSSGQIAMFKVIYGLSADSLDLETRTQTMSLTIPQTDTAKTYFFKVYPQDENGNDVGAASDIVNVGPIQNTKTTAVCVIDNIQLSSKQIGDAYYITWNKAPGAIKYHIYRSESKTDSLIDMVKVGETIETKFEYPFDPQASQELYAYYRVEGICADNKTTKLSNVKQVKVGPKENIMMLMLVGLIIYSIFQLKSIRRSS